jgi:hypothetical protein
MQMPKLSAVAALSIFPFFVLGCQAEAPKDTSSVLDVPSISGSVAEYVETRTAFADSVIRLVVLADGQVAWYQGTSSTPATFVKYVGSLGSGIVGNIRAFSSEAALTQADTEAALVNVSWGPDECSGQESDETLVLRRSGDHSTLAVRRAPCSLQYNRSLIDGEGFLTSVGGEADNLFQMLELMRRLAGRRQ